MSVHAYAAPSHEDNPDVIVRDMITPDRAIDDFLDDGLRRGWSTRTLTTYRRILLEFDARLPVDADVTEITSDDVRRYLGSKKKLARGTIAHAESVLASWFLWLVQEQKIKASPMSRLRRTKRIRAEDLDVVSVSTDQARKLIAAAAALDAIHSTVDRPRWTYRLCLGLLLYMGPRRHAVAQLRLRDYDPKAGQIRFREKGNKFIRKPVPGELRAWLDEAIADKLIVKPTDFLIPPPPYAFYSDKVLEGAEERDGRCIWVLVKEAGRKAGVETHVHALRAAFAVFYLERNPGDIRGLQESLGHSNIATTAIYLRKLEKQTAMEPMRELSWAVEA